MGNLYTDIPEELAEESFLELLSEKHVRIERIVSKGQATQSGEWLEQDRAEWVIVLKGSAALRFEGDAPPRKMKAGDFVNIPARCRHRVEWTTTDEPTVWLAVHYPP